MRGKVSLLDIAEKVGVSVKTVSGALHNDAIRMAEPLRERIRALAQEMGYEPNIVARGMRQGVMPVIGLVAEGLITMPFATEIVRSLDNAARGFSLSVVATNVGASRSAETGVAEARRFLPKSIAFATMYNRVVTLAPETRKLVDLTINCREASGTIPAIVPDERQGAQEIVAHCFARGRRRIAFLNLPGILAGVVARGGVPLGPREFRHRR